MSTEGRKTTGFWTSTVITAIIALVGGAISGFLTAYVQLSETKHKYSIERARVFQTLMGQLEKKETSRLAVLNLWQLYPEERDRKIIIAAAFAVNQPDLVEIIGGIDDELTPVADVLQAKTHSKNPQESTAALATLLRIDPVRAASVIIKHLSEGISQTGDGIRHTMLGEVDLVFELIDLARKNETVVKMIHSKYESYNEIPLLYDYILYRAARQSKFIPRLTDAYSKDSELTMFNDCLIKANFYDKDVLSVVTVVKKFITAELNSARQDNLELQNALVGLRNNNLNNVLKTTSDGDFISLLGDTVLSSSCDDLTRARAFALLRKTSSLDAFNIMAQFLAKNERPMELTKTITKKILGLLRTKEENDPKFRRPADCKDTTPDICVANNTSWARWLSQKN